MERHIILGGWGEEERHNCQVASVSTADWASVAGVGGLGGRKDRERQLLKQKGPRNREQHE